MQEVSINIHIFVLSEDSKYIWIVPISVSTSDSPKDAVSKTLLETGSSVIEIANLAADKWVKVTILGFYPS
jgi:puromycin-sensitive aminopeptidase